MSEPTRLLEVGELDLRFEPTRWAFAERQATSIATHWARLTKAKPSLFNGRVLLLGQRAFETGADGVRRLKGVFFETDYADFVAWSDFGHPTEPVDNCFSMAALRSDDGAFLLGEMAHHTFNAGQIYFPAGTPDPATCSTARSTLRPALAGNCSKKLGSWPLKRTSRLTGLWRSRLSASLA